VIEALRAAYAKTSASRLVAIAWIGGLLGVLLHSVLLGGYIANSEGHPMPGEFLAIWSAGQLAAAGHAVDSYDARLLHQAQIADTQTPFGGYFMWLCPPPFLLVAAALSTLPFVVAYIGWAVVTLAGYAICTARLFRDRAAAIAYGASPAAFVTFIVAQNGLLTAALFGGVLLTLQRRPVLSGLLLAALIVKPQFGLLFPLALLAAGQWRTVAVATIATSIWLFACLAFEPSLISAFLHALAFARTELLTQGHQGWYKLQTLYGVLRIAGLNDDWSSGLTAVLALALAAVVIVAWHSRLPFPLKAAILVVCSLAISPYSYVFDFPLLTIALGYLWRDSVFDNFERRMIFVSYLLVAVAIVSATPLAFFGLCAIALIVWRRTRRRVSGAVSAAGIIV
jgi:arabinofuranan 3-O-arabinosyltransferase